ncbi:glycosyltransferase family 4 protein [Cohnella sp. GCM10027633]|uniref:glycosyltransferase family 4 protein n=1 Tax=unclassified Cohnella TaxID=2636738 RepID=UPI003632F6E8
MAGAAAHAKQRRHRRGRSKTRVASGSAKSQARLRSKPAHRHPRRALRHRAVRRKAANAVHRRGRSRSAWKRLAHPPVPVEAITAETAVRELSEELLRALNADAQAEDLGINLIGYARSETGMGESCRLAARAIESAGLPFGILPVDLDNLVNVDISWAHKESAVPHYNTNIFHINATEMPLVGGRFGETLFRNRLNIGYWHWELPEFPDEFLHGLELLDEVWVPTRFVGDSIAAKSNVPTVVVPHGVYVEELPEHLNRKWFGLPEDRFLFLCMYDSYSIKARKNPQAVIEAFRRLMSEHRQLRAELVVKINHPTEAETAALREQLAGIPNVRIIDRVFGRTEAKALIRCADCVVSLHRSEGFGLPLAEAMYLGIPVIGTNWSGNTDFMNANNAGVVNYRLVQVGQDYGPYRAHQTWAEPDVDHAAYLMRMMVTDAKWRETIARNGQATIRAHFSPRVAGKRIRDRLSAVRADFRPKR